MAGQNNWRVPITAADLMGSMQKRIMHDERRPQIRTAADVLGPGLGPKAVRLLDWNDAATAFNGIFYSEPGANNSPDTTRYWMGTVFANDGGAGYQRVVEYRAFTDPVPQEWERTFLSTAGVTLNYGPWIAIPRPPFAEAAGTQNVVAAALAVGGVNTYAVSFPAGRFTQVPIVQVTLQGAPGGSASASVRATAITTTGFSVALYNTHPTSAMTFASTPAGWQAVQMLTGSAAG